MCTKLQNLRGNGDIVEETKAHMLVRFGMVTRRPYDRKCFLHFAACHSKTCFNDATGTKLSCVRRCRVHIKRQVIIIRLRVGDVLFGQG